MPQPKSKKFEVVKVRLSCIYSGADFSCNAGSVVSVDPAEAARLVNLGVGKIEKTQR